MHFSQIKQKNGSGQEIIIKLLGETAVDADKLI